MKVGKINSKSRLKPIHKPQAHSHHQAPVAPITQSINATSGRPISMPIRLDLSRSMSQSLSVILLKPKRSSITKVWYSVSGKSITPLIRANAASKATCWPMPPPSHANSPWLSAERPPSSVQITSIAVPKASSSRPKRALAMV